MSDRELIEALVADPLQREHLVRIDEGGVHVRHPIDERVGEQLFLDCEVLDTIVEAQAEEPIALGTYRFVIRRDGDWALRELEQ